MVAVDDYRHGDTIPPLTIWQMIQMIPFILFLREYLFLFPHFLMWEITLRFYDVI